MDIKGEIIARVTERAGIDADTAGKAVDSVIDFLKENPEKVASLVGNIELPGALKGLFGR